MLPKLSIIVVALLLLGCGKTTFTYSKFDAYDDLERSITRYSASIESRQINWDSISTLHRDLISESMTEQEYFEAISDLLITFQDPHVWLLAPFDSMYSIQQMGYSKNYSSALTDTYLRDVQFHSPQITSAFIQDSIGYLFCQDFKGDQLTNAAIYAQVINRFSNTKGLIIDLRVNDGGSVYNAHNLLNKFTDQKLLWHTTQNRTSEGFDQPFEWFIEPDLASHYPHKVIVLNGRFTISAGERFAIGAKLIDQLTIIGDTTANTQGSVMGREMLNGWKYTLTFEKCLNPDGINFAGKGIPPDEYRSFEGAEAANRDFILERAIELLE